MKRKKSLIALAAGAAICLSGLFTFSACDLFGGGDSVTEVTELTNINNEKQNYKLTQDIDFEGGEEKIFMCSAKTFDGDGHTIKNLNLRGQYGGNSGELSIFQNAGTIKNLNIENLTINASHYTHVSALAWGKVDLIENVHIKNLTINATQPLLGSGLGRSIKEIFVAGFTTVEGVTIRNCTLTNSSITVKGYNNSDHDHIADIHVAGMATGASSVSYCGIENTTISVESTSAYSDVTVGGLSSRSGKLTDVSYCYAKNNNITAKAEWSSKSKVEKQYSTSYAYVGGIAVTASNVNFCEAVKNNITAAASGSLIAGSVVGSASVVHQSIARNNTVTCTGGRSDNEDEGILRSTGGLAGRISSSATSCISINNGVSDSATHTVTKGSFKLYAGGLAGDVPSGSSSFKKCYVGGNSVSGFNSSGVAVGYNGMWDIFIDGTVSRQEDHTSVVAGQDNLKNPAWVSENLQLSANSWVLTDGEWPTVNFTYTPPEVTADD